MATGGGIWTGHRGALSSQAKDLRGLDVRNQINVPRDPKERLAIYDNLPANLRQVFVDACEAADKRKGAGK